MLGLAVIEASGIFPGLIDPDFDDGEAYAAFCVSQARRSSSVPVWGDSGLACDLPRPKKLTRGEVSAYCPNPEKLPRVIRPPKPKHRWRRAYVYDHRIGPTKYATCSAVSSRKFRYFGRSEMEGLGWEWRGDWSHKKTQFGSAAFELKTRLVFYEFDPALSIFMGLYRDRIQVNRHEFVTFQIDSK